MVNQIVIKAYWIKYSGRQIAAAFDYMKGMTTTRTISSSGFISEHLEGPLQKKPMSLGF